MKSNQYKKNKDQAAITRLAEKIVFHRFSVPSIFFLEMVKYMSYIGSQLLVFFGPVITIFIQDKSYDQITHLLEDRNNVEFLMMEIERIEAENKLKVGDESK